MQRHPRPGRLLGLALSLVGCGPGNEGPHARDANAGGNGNGGAPTAPGGTGGTNDRLLVHPAMYQPVDLPFKLLDDSDEIELWRAPQGGHVLLVGARVENLESNRIEIRARLRNPDTQEILAEATRNVDMEPVPGQPGWMQTARRSRTEVAHVPVCPNYDARSVRDAEQILDVEVTAIYGDFATGTASVVVLPTCQQDSVATKTACECECEADYSLGKCTQAPALDGGATGLSEDSL